MIGIEDLDEQDLRQVAAFYVRLAERAKDAGPRKEVHSIDEEGLPTEPVAAQAVQNALPASAPASAAGTAP